LGTAVRYVIAPSAAGGVAGGQPTATYLQAGNRPGAGPGPGAGGAQVYTTVGGLAMNGLAGMNMSTLGMNGLQHGLQHAHVQQVQPQPQAYRYVYTNNGTYLMPVSTSTQVSAHAPINYNAQGLAAINAQVATVQAQAQAQAINTQGLSAQTINALAAGGHTIAGVPIGANVGMGMGVGMGGQTIASRPVYIRTAAAPAIAGGPGAAPQVVYSMAQASTQASAQASVSASAQASGQASASASASTPSSSAPTMTDINTGSSAQSQTQTPGGTPVQIINTNMSMTESSSPSYQGQGQAGVAAGQVARPATVNTATTNRNTPLPSTLPSRAAATIQIAQLGQGQGQTQVHGQLRQANMNLNMGTNVHLPVGVGMGMRQTPHTQPALKPVSQSQSQSQTAPITETTRILQQQALMSQPKPRPRINMGTLADGAPAPTYTQYTSSYESVMGKNKAGASSGAGAVAVARPGVVARPGAGARSGAVAGADGRRTYSNTITTTHPSTATHPNTNGKGSDEKNDDDHDFGNFDANNDSDSSSGDEVEIVSNSMSISTAMTAPTPASSIPTAAPSVSGPNVVPTRNPPAPIPVTLANTGTGIAGIQTITDLYGSNKTTSLDNNEHASAMSYAIPPDTNANVNAIARNVNANKNTTNTNTNTRTTTGVNVNLNAVDDLEMVRGGVNLNMNMDAKPSFHANAHRKTGISVSTNTVNKAPMANPMIQDRLKYNVAQSTKAPVTATANACRTASASSSSTATSTSKPKEKVQALPKELPPILNHTSHTLVVPSDIGEIVALASSMVAEEIRSFGFDLLNADAEENGGKDKDGGAVSCFNQTNPKLAAEMNLISAAASIEHFAESVILPQFLAARAANMNDTIDDDGSKGGRDASEEHKKKMISEQNKETRNRVFLGVLLSLREVLAQNCISIFGSIFRDHNMNSIDKECGWPSSDISGMKNEKYVMQAQSLSTTLILNVISKLEPESSGNSNEKGDDMIVKFLSVVRNYDSAEGFAKHLKRADIRSIAVTPGGNKNEGVMKRTENQMCRVSFNIARGDHPLIKGRDSKEMYRVQNPIPNAAFVSIVEQIPPSKKLKVNPKEDVMREFHERMQKILAP